MFKILGILIVVLVSHVAVDAADKVRLGFPDLAAQFVPLPLAEKRDFLKEQGLQGEFIRIRPAISSAALVSGEIDYDMVIGSRYVPGGDTVNWSAMRKCISRTANFMAHHFLGLKPKDCTSGFRLYHNKTLKNLDFETIRADGYSYLVEILHRASTGGLRIAEIPIIFVERAEGTSKISRKEIWKALHTILRLRRNPSWQKKEMALKT